MIGKNKDGIEVATHVTGENGEPINQDSRVENVVCNIARNNSAKRKNKRKGLNPMEKKKINHNYPDLEKKPDIPEGKNPISIYYEFANTCTPKKIPSINLVSQNTRGGGMVSDFTFEARLDDKPIAQGRAKTKKDAKTYAAWYALESLERETESNKLEIKRIKQGIPSVKKQMRSFTKRKWKTSNNYQNSSLFFRPQTTTTATTTTFDIVPQLHAVNVSQTFDPTAAANTLSALASAVGRYPPTTPTT